MQISVIIPTYNRVKDLNECLNSILIQTNPPKEIIIIDNSTNNESENLIKDIRNKFETKGIFLKYIKNERENSLTMARNMGIENSRGEVNLFLDDDTILDKNYIREILKIYEKYPDSLGVQGYIETKRPFKIMNLVSKVFFLDYFKRDECKVLPSISSTYPYSLNKVISCQWLSGANHSFKRHILKEFQYDEKLKKYSEGEDLDLSYRVSQKYPGSLYITPYAKLIHKTSPAGRVLGKEFIYMKEVYGLYLFYKNIDQNMKNKLIYLWSRIGKIIFNIGSSIFKLSKSGLIRNKYLIKSYVYCLKHIKEIKRGNLEFFNKTLE
jgi:GT2 family glycosyltransferase